MTTRTTRTVYAIPTGADFIGNAVRIGAATSITAAVEQVRAAGYRVIVLQDRVRFEIPGAEIYTVDVYEGYARSVNHLYRTVPGVADAPVVVFIGDDMEPDPSRSPGAIREEFLARFPDTFGVMQPIGDGLAGVDRICGSPWIGRSFATRINGGQGPFWPDYYHFFADEELHEVATRLGVLWQRRDLSHYHDHWTRRGERPPHLEEAQNRWSESKAIHDRRKAEGYPGHQPILFASPAPDGGTVLDRIRKIAKGIAEYEADPEMGGDWNLDNVREMGREIVNLLSPGAPS